MISGEADISKIDGNASDNIKEILGNIPLMFARSPVENGAGTFGASILKRMAVTELSVLTKAEEPQKLEARAVCELTVEEDMINGGGNIHGGCSAFLIDVCSTLALMTLSMTNSPDADFQALRSVSQSLNVVYHSPAGLGDKIRLVNSTMTLGARAQSARTEIWNLTHHRLVASGVHVKMQPSPPKSRL